MIFGAPRTERRLLPINKEIALADQEGMEALKELEDFFRMEDSEWSYPYTQRRKAFETPD